MDKYEAVISLNNDNISNVAVRDVYQVLAMSLIAVPSR